MSRKFAIITTSAECYRDIHEVIAEFYKEHDTWLCPSKLKEFDCGGYEVEIVICVPRFTVDQVRAAIARVDDAGDMNYYMKVQMFDFPDEPVGNSDHIRKHGTAVSNVMTYERDVA